MEQGLGYVKPIQTHLRVEISIPHAKEENQTHNPQVILRFGNMQNQKIFYKMFGHFH